MALRCEGEAGFVVGDGADGVEAVELDVPGIGRGDLERIEEQSGALGIDAIGGERVGDIDEGELNGDGILEGGQVESCTFRSIRFCGCADWIWAVVDGFYLVLILVGCGERGESAVRAATIVAEALAFLKAAVKVAPVAVVNDRQIASASRVADISTFAIH